MAGVIYNYFLEGYSECSGVISNGRTYITEGYCQPYGIISGRIAYNGNQGVSGVTVSVQGNIENSISRSILFTEEGKSYAEFFGCVM